MRQVVLTVLIMWPQEILTLCEQEETKIGKMSWKINAEEIMVGITTRRCITRLCLDVSKIFTTFHTAAAGPVWCTVCPLETPCVTRINMSPLPCTSNKRRCLIDG